MNQTWAPVPSDASRGSEERYKNLLITSKNLQNHGAFLKGSVLFIGGLGSVAGILSFSEGHSLLGISTLIAATLVGIFVYFIGVIIAASGEALLALSDIAINTAKE